MPKSTPRPTNNGMNATEIRLNRPMISRPAPAVRIRPTTVVARMATISRTDFTANHSISTMEPSMTEVIRVARCFSEANCSSFSGTEPVRRTVTP
jgi:hypothetical protein